MAATTSPTYTGCMRACAPAKGKTGSQRASDANILVKLSSGPKMTDGRKMVQPPSLLDENSLLMAASPSPLERWYMLSPCESAPSALMCNRRRTPWRWQARAMRCGRWTCARAKSEPYGLPTLPCRMPTRFTTTSQSVTSSSSAASSWMSVWISVVVGWTCSSLPRANRRVGTMIWCRSPESRAIR
ncbi:hypothetical protein D3C87_1521630 [compost metagenome]